MYTNGILYSAKSSLPVICVGNLTMGGSGKTPVVMYLADLLQKNGFNPAIVSRGFKGKASDETNIVSDGAAVLLSASDAGDEPYLMAASLPGIPVLTGKKRFFPCRYIEKNYPSDVILLDDGFQHLKLQREINLVLFNCSSLTKNYNTFPGGILREPFSALSDSDAIVYTNYEDSSATIVKEFSQFLSKYLTHKRFFTLQFTPSHLVDSDGRQLPLDYLRDHTNISAFCGIASPYRFMSTLQRIGLNIVFFKNFSDHHTYSAEDINSIVDAAKKRQSSILLTTEKDLVKIKAGKIPFPLFAVSMKLKTPQEFDSFILKYLKQKVN